MKADIFADGVLKRVSSPVAAIRCRYDSPALDRQVLFGHPVLQLETQKGLSCDQTTGYVGYIDPNELSDWCAPTHRVAVRTSLLFAEPDIKSPNPRPVSCGALLCTEDRVDRFTRTHTGEYAITAHLAEIDQSKEDAASLAEKLVGTPYLWGGNSAFGIDCSGLIQLAMQSIERPCRGDSDQQFEMFSKIEFAKRTRGDLVFWPGHVAMLLDTDTIIHANGFHMAVATEPLENAISRILSLEGKEVLGYARP